MTKISKIAMALMMAGLLVSVDAFAATKQACPAWTYSKAGAKSKADCISCATLGTNRYSKSEASTSCATCPNGKIANETATGCLDACSGNQLLSGDKCIACPTGYKCNGTALFECLDGYYAGEQVTTKTAKNGKKTTTKKQTCLACPANSIKCTSSTDFTCKTGFFKKGTGCAACPPQSASCTQESFTCNDGFYENLDKGTCVACPAGYYCSSLVEGAEQFY